MKIKLVYPDHTSKEFFIEKDKVQIGRSQKCDITIDSPVISRQHLKFIKFENQFFVEVVAKNNWISVNGKKLESFPRQLYYSNMRIELPGQIKVSVDMTESVKEELQKGIGKDAQRLIDRIANAKPIQAFVDHRVVLVKFLMFAIPTAIGIFAATVYFDKKNAVKKVPKAKRVYKEQKIKKEEIKWFNERKKISPNQFPDTLLKALIMRNQKCAGRMVHLCTHIFKVKRAPMEGIQPDKQNSYIVTVNSKATRLRLKDKYSLEVIEKLTDREVLKLYAVEYFLEEKLFFRLKKSAVHRITLIMFDYEGNQVEYLTDIIVPVVKSPDINYDELTIILNEIKDKRASDRLKKFLWWID